MEYKNLLIQGGACCGKTYEAKRLACCAIGLLTENDRLNEQQFKDNAGAGKQIEYVPIHEEYEYSLFVQGIEVNAVNGNMINYIRCT